MRVLLAVDGSEQSFEAARAIGRLARPEHLTVLHALDVPTPTPAFFMPEAVQDLYRAVEREMREDGDRLLARVRSIMPEDCGIIDTRIETGSPADAIVSTAERERIDLIVMGARGLTPTKEVAFGSVSHRVVAHAPCSVLIVNRPMPALTRVLLPIEGREDAEAIIRWFERRPWASPVHIDVLHVLPLDGRWTQRLTNAEKLTDMASRAAQRFVEDIAARLSLVQCCAVPMTRRGVPALTVLQQAAELKPDLIVMGPRARSGATRFLLGSVSHKVLHAAPCPVLIVR
ncbi:universal stress protein [Candidatus Nitrospira bockiana]